jgi:hypothetical protein
LNAGSIVAKFTLLEVPNTATTPTSLAALLDAEVKAGGEKMRQADYLNAAVTVATAAPVAPPPSSSSSSSGGLGIGAIVGIVVGALIVVAVVAFCLLRSGGSGAGGSTSAKVAPGGNIA